MNQPFDRSSVQIAARAAGNLVRFAFYTVGLFALAAVGLVALWIWNRLPPSPESVKAQPVFQIGANALSRRLQLGKAEDRREGWVESLQYGQLYDRDVDMTVVMIVPKEAYQGLTRNYASEIAALRPISNRFYGSNTTYYELETRFGPLRASEFTVNADGRTKLCISYLSRFDTAAFYLKGWYCEANGARPSYSALACIIEQLALKRPLASAEATSAAEMLRGACLPDHRHLATPATAAAGSVGHDPESGCWFTDWIMPKQIDERRH